MSKTNDLGFMRVIEDVKGDTSEIRVSSRKGLRLGLRRGDQG